MKLNKLGLILVFLSASSLLSYPHEVILDNAIIVSKNSYFNKFTKIKIIVVSRHGVSVGNEFIKYNESYNISSSDMRHKTFEMNTVKQRFGALYIDGVSSKPVDLKILRNEQKTYVEEVSAEIKNFSDLKNKIQQEEKIRGKLILWLWHIISLTADKIDLEKEIKDLFPESHQDFVKKYTKYKRDPSRFF